MVCGHTSVVFNVSCSHRKPVQCLVRGRVGYNRVAEGPLTEKVPCERGPFFRLHSYPKGKSPKAGLCLVICGRSWRLVTGQVGLRSLNDLGKRVGLLSKE